MLYTYNGDTWTFSKEFEKKNPNKVPKDRTVYAFAYDVDNNYMLNRLKCLPTAGEVKDTVWGEKFCPYKKDSKAFKKSGMVNSSARYYADTYEEAVEGYNSLIQDRIDWLNKLIEDCNNEMINVV